MLIAFIPFPTSLSGHHPGQPIATAFYGVVCKLTGSAFWLMRWYASTHGELMKREIPKGVLRRRVRISLLSPLVYFIGAAISLFYATFALLWYAAKRGRDEAAPVACALRRRPFGGVARVGAQILRFRQAIAYSPSGPSPSGCRHLHRAILAACVAEPCGGFA
jgi:hypothetical protein